MSRRCRQPGRGRAASQAAEAILINLALTVLKDAAYRGQDKPIAILDVRLAMRVLYPYLGTRTRSPGIGRSSRRRGSTRGRMATPSFR